MTAHIIKDPDTGLNVLAVERHYKVSEAAEKLGSSPQYVRDRIDSGEIDTIVELGNGNKQVRRIPASALQRFIDNRSYGPNRKRAAA